MRRDPLARRGMSEETVTNAQLKKYCDVISAWRRKFDTAEIARLLDLPEELVARWVSNFQDMRHGAAS